MDDRLGMDRARRIIHGERHARALAWATVLLAWATVLSLVGDARAPSRPGGLSEPGSGTAPVGDRPFAWLGPFAAPAELNLVSAGVAPARRPWMARSSAVARSRT